MSGSKMAPTYCWTFWSLGLKRQRLLQTRVPTQITCRTFKQHPRALKASGKKGGQYSRALYPIQISNDPQACDPGLSSARGCRAAQYSPDWSLVKRAHPPLRGPESARGGGERIRAGPVGVCGSL